MSEYKQHRRYIIHYTKLLYDSLSKHNGYVTVNNITWKIERAKHQPYIWFFKDDMPVNESEIIYYATMMFKLRCGVQNVIYKEELRKLIDTNKAWLIKEYKIHLQIKIECLYAIIMHIINAPAELMQHIKNFKFLNNYMLLYNKNKLPGIVIYFTDIDTNEKLELFLTKFKTYMHIYANKNCTIPITPRCARKVNDLIYYVQSLGDLKLDIIEVLRKNGWDNEYLTEDHAEFI